MKHILAYKILGIFVTAILLFASCTKETADVKLDSKLSTSQVSNVKSDSATVVGFVIASGSGFTEKGVCYDTQTAPTVDKSKVVFSGTSTTATYTVTLTGLNFATKYYARAYAKSASGVIYGDELTFTTLPVAPTVTTTASVSSITNSTATSGGEVTATGGADVTARGICFSTTHTPTIANSKTTDGTGTGSFTSAITGLKMNTTYYVRAYATNSAGTAYGSEVSFTTLNITKLYIVGAYNSWDNSDAAKTIVLNSAGTYEGYVNMPAGDFKLTSDHSWSDPATYGASSTTGSLTNPGNNITVAAGYYFINVDLAKMTYSTVATSWGVIGDATPNGWNDETALTFDATSQTWKGTITLTTGSFKFRANHSWDYNYGSDQADGTLSAGGGNIPVVAGTYNIVLDLSHPNAYAYSITSTNTKKK
jgi:starch-binding outer membrane protein SusE/F